MRRILRRYLADERPAFDGISDPQAERVPKMTIELDWLTWTRELQVLALSGLTFTQDKYDRERYEAMRTLASRMMAMHTGVPGHADRGTL